jgi:membrane protein YdbS with pleckstrin-like domain
MQTLDPRVVWLWRAQAALQALASLAVILPVLYAVNRVISLTPFLALGVVLLIGQIVWIFLGPFLAWRRFRYALREQDLYVEQGVIVRQCTSVPYARIQHVDASQGPVERLFGLEEVTVYSAAGRSADGSIPGLEEEAAQALREALVARASASGHDGV